MAFTKTQTLDSVLLRQLNFRTNANAPISSFYSLYATGNGQTYWSNAVLPTHISTVSTVIGNQASTFNSSVVGITNLFTSSIVDLSTNQSTIDGSWKTALYSTSVSLAFIDQQFSNSINGLNLQFGILSNTLGMQVNSIYTSTLLLVNSTLTSTTTSLNNGLTSTVNYVNAQLSNASTSVAAAISTAVFRFNSTVLGISSISTFYVEFSGLASTTYAGLSSLSTALSVQNASTFNSLTSTINQGLSNLAISSFKYTTGVYSTVSSLFTLKETFNAYSTLASEQLVSTSAGLLDAFNQYNIESGLSTIYYSSIIPMESTVVSLETRITDLELFSTNLSTVTHEYISSFVSTSQTLQNLAIYESISSISTTIEVQSQQLAALSTSYSTFASQTNTQLSNQNSSFAFLTSSILDLQYEFSVITTSSILAGIYESFIDLESYTANLIFSTVNTTFAFQSTLYVSTVDQNNSISQSYFNFYVSTMYASTLSTLIPSTVAYASTLVSSLYFIGNSTINSALNSTVINLTNQFYMSTIAITDAIVLSTGVQFQSSVLAYLSTPTGQSLSTFSSLAFRSLSTFSGQGSTLLSTTSSLLGSTLNFYTVNLGVLYISSMGQLSTFATRASTLLVQTATQLSSFSTQFGGQMSTQNFQFTSTLQAYNSTLGFFVQSTNTYIINSTIALTNEIVTDFEASSLRAFNIYVSTFYASSINLSSIYTFSNYNLNSSNFVANLDIATTRHFYINIYDIADNPESIYRITYDSNFMPYTDYRQGTININISTVGRSYSRNNGKLRFDMYAWGLPTTVWGNVYPFISNSDYFIQYNYTIVCNVIYTTLNNIYPRLEVQNLQIQPVVCNVQNSNTGQWLSNTFWRGTPVNLSWSNYSFFPFGAIGTPPYSPEIAIEVFDGDTKFEYGPYPFTQSTATITAPYLRGKSNTSNVTNVRAFIVGNPTRVAQTSFNTFMPYFTTIAVNNTSQYMGGAELVALTDSGRAPLEDRPINFLGILGVSSFNNSPLYQGRNLINGLLNTTVNVGNTSTVMTNSAANSNVQGNFFENSASSGFADFYVNLGNNYFRNISTVAAFNTSVRFTIASLTTSYSFIGTNMSNVSGTLWRIFNPGVTKTTNTFSNTGSTQNYIRYNYSAVQFISSLGIYEESTFIGPNNGTVPNTLAQMNITDVITGSIRDAVSTVLFYNLPTTSPVTPVSTANTRLRMALTLPDGFTYMSTVFTTSAGSTRFNF